MMTIVKRALAAARGLAASLYFLWAFVFFSIAVWVIWSVGHFGWLADIIGAVIAWYGVSFVRQGCEELLLNRPEQPKNGRRNPSQ
jgi:threonine/homoserine/homoserine lactone efflux protein